jgi:hypothetical protein
MLRPPFGCGEQPTVFTCLFRSNLPLASLPPAVMHAVIPDHHASKLQVHAGHASSTAEPVGANPLAARPEPHTPRDILTGMRIQLKCRRGFLRDRRATTQAWVRGQWRRSTRRRACRWERSTPAGSASSTAASLFTAWSMSDCAQPGPGSGRSHRRCFAFRSTRSRLAPRRGSRVREGNDAADARPHGSTSERAARPGGREIGRGGALCH